ncbi:hypothetical protein EVAR_51579_1 [Eumeta japonica]|uniref:Uncharacterized protein n=1 Tax=Eumeta variegata TaxID=151549 RepID=A0A4C1YI27_EUMVA|nr:hypothetical protein EVAR_51579_1 [Eumeta japonica]
MPEHKKHIGSSVKLSDYRFESQGFQLMTSQNQKRRGRPQTASFMRAPQRTRQRTRGDHSTRSRLKEIFKYRPRRAPPARRRGGGDKHTPDELASDELR